MLGGVGFAMPVAKLPKIADYDGKEAELEGWMSRTEALLAEYPSLSLYDASSVRYASLFLKGKARDVWDFKVRELLGDRTGGCQDWDEFCDLLRSLLGPKNVDILGRKQLRSLHQTGSVRRYTADFLRIMRSLRRPMADFDLREAYIGHLKEAVQKHVRTQALGDETLQQAISAAQLYEGVEDSAPSRGRGSRSGPSPMDLGAMSDTGSEVSSYSRGRTPERRGRGKSPRGNSGQRGKSPRRSATPGRNRTPQKGRAKPSPLTPQEREKCMKEGLCLRCRQSGHYASQCPVYRKN